MEMKHCVEVDPKFFPAWAAMGLSLLQDGKYLDAIKALVCAVGVRPEEVEVGYHLGVAYLKNNELVQAVEQFRKVLAIKPDHEASKKALALVEASIAYKKSQEAPLPSAPEPSPTPTLDKPPPVKPEPEPESEPEPEPKPELEPKRESTVEEKELEKAFDDLTVEDEAPVEVTKAFRSKTVEEGELSQLTMGNEGEDVLIQMDFELSELTYPGPYPTGIRVDRREQYLTDDLFKEMFKMTKTEFYGLRKWRQMAKKKEVGLW